MEELPLWRVELLKREVADLRTELEAAREKLEQVASNYSTEVEHGRLLGNEVLELRERCTALEAERDRLWVQLDFWKGQLRKSNKRHAELDAVANAASDLVEHLEPSDKGSCVPYERTELDRLCIALAALDAGKGEK